MKGFRQVGLAFVLLSAPVAAQVAPSPAAPTAQQIAPTREEIERTAPPAARRRAPRLEVEGEIERTPCPLAEPAFAGIRVTLTEARFDGLRGLDAAALRETYADYIGREAPIAIVCEIRDRAAAVLKNAGYLAAVRVPPQTIDGGVVRFEVVQARLTALRVRGDAGRAERSIAAYLGPLAQEPAFNGREAERYLLLASDIPGYDVRLTLRPADTGVPGDVIGEVTVLRRPLDLDFSAQNYGSRDVGRFGGLLRLQLYGLTGLDDRTTLGAYSTGDFEEQQVLQFAHDMRLGREGLSLGGRLTYAWTEPAAAGLDIDAKTFVASAEVGYPFVRRQTGSVRAAGGFDFIDQEVRFGGLPFTTDHLRVAFARLDAEAVDPQQLDNIATLGGPRWRLFGTVEARHGLDVFDASRRCPAAGCGGATPASRPQADATAFVLRAAASGELWLAPGFGFALSPRAQYAPNALLSFEEFSGGNYTVGRGFDPGSVSGDSGLGFGAEMRFGRAVPRTRDDLAFEPFLFLDQAWVWNEDREFDGLDPQTLTSGGAGVRVAYGDRARMELTLAIPIDREGVAPQRTPTRLLFSLVTRLLPWTR